MRRYFSDVVYALLLIMIGLFGVPAINNAIAQGTVDPIQPPNLSARVAPGGVCPTAGQGWSVGDIHYVYIDGTGRLCTFDSGPTALSGMLVKRIQSAATTNATSVKASQGNVVKIVVGNNGASVAYLKLYNLATAPTVGTSTPVMTILLPVAQNIVVSSDVGDSFSTGIAYAITGGAADTDTSAVAANQVVGAISYQ